MREKIFVLKCYVKSLSGCESKGKQQEKERQKQEKSITENPKEMNKQTKTYRKGCKKFKRPKIQKDKINI